MYHNNKRCLYLFADAGLPTDCADVAQCAAKSPPSGVYTIYPQGYETTGVEVYCDMDTGGWTVSV